MCYKLRVPVFWIDGLSLYDSNNPVNESVSVYLQIKINIREVFNRAVKLVSNIKMFSLHIHTYEAYDLQS